MVDKGKFKIIVNTFIPFNGFAAMNLFGLIFVRREWFENPLLKQATFDKMIRHESIHTKQIIETGIIFFYIWYLLEWIVRLFMKGNAYKSIVFEQEAYANELSIDYLKTRKFWNFLKYYKKNK
jgi:hypothetical protein